MQKKEVWKKFRTDWRRKCNKKTIKSNYNKKIKEKIEKAKNHPLSKSDILQVITKSEHFLGIFSSDQLTSLNILTYPSVFITNTDQKGLAGSHWVAIRISARDIEIFDPLGGHTSLWGSYPFDFLQFFNKYCFSHQFKVSPILQPPFSLTCGLYCALFVKLRFYYTFNQIVGMFSLAISKNDKILFQLLKNI